MMRKKIEADKEKARNDLLAKQQLLEQEKDDEDRLEIAQTEHSKKLTSTMIQSSQNGSDDVLHRVVEVLRDQNGKCFNISRLNHFKFVSFQIHSINGFLKLTNVI